MDNNEQITVSSDAVHVPLTAASRAWVGSAVAPGARVIATRRLVGGITSSVHSCQIELPSGSRTRVVLRRWPGQQDSHASARVTREASTLTRLAAAAVPSPELIATDVGGAHNDGLPSLLMTRLPGRLHLVPSPTWIDQLAGVLPLIHGSDIDAPPYESWLEDDLTPPPWSKHPHLWQHAIDIVTATPSPYRPTFIHRDFQHFNVLWSRGRLTGVVDWIEASIGPPDMDVGHCRLNLAVLFSAECADAFRDSYEHVAGRSVDPYWDLAAIAEYLPGWGEFLQAQAGNRAVVDFAGMHARVDTLLASAMRRV